MASNLNIILIIVFANLFVCAKRDTLPEQQQITQKNSSFSIEVFATNLEVPWSIIFTSSERILVNERPGRLRVIENGKLSDNPLKVITDISSGSEEGLMGLALDPDYQNNKLIYLSYAYEKNGDLFDKVVRFKDEGSSLSGEKVIFDNIPAARFHCGCRLRFGPDNKLYITTGDAGDRGFSQNLDKLNGKIIRVNTDGSVPGDNPFPNSPVWSYGHRNPQGIDWYPGTDIMWETEHGPSGFDGPGGGDEVNVIVKGKNYGWPEVHHRDHKEGMVDPVLEFTPAEAPASGMFYRSGKIAEFKNNFFFGCLKGEGIIRVVADEKDPTKAVSNEKIATTYGRIRDIAEGPDGFIYFSSSNKDGRGKPIQGDDKIYRIIPK